VESGQLSSSCPRIVIAGANSGVGKTSVSLALVTALRKRGLRVQPFKVGPDYLDPTYLSLASGRPCYNLDGWMTNQEYVRELFVESTRDADIAVIEGVMGLFDGADTHSLEGSTAEIAQWLNAPVILVVNVHGLARSLAPIVKGFAEFQSGVNVVGVIANHCGSERHGELLAECLASSQLPPLLGAVPRDAFPRLPSRHLGLVTAESSDLTSDSLNHLGESLEQYGFVSEIIAAAESASQLSLGLSRPRPVSVNEDVRIGLAYDQAFHFYYPDNLQALEAFRCELVRFSPITDQQLPNDLDAIYLGGGYPEEFAEQLAANSEMLASVRQFAESGRTIYGECGGLMYLSRGIQTRDGKRHKLVGLLPAWTRMLDRLKSLGYIEATLARGSLFGDEGFSLRGHEFHYSELLEDPTEDKDWTHAYRTKSRRSEEFVPKGFQSGKILVSYIHLHFASRPEAVERFVAVCKDDSTLV
jgi:cobyrinic acid a,c-diamide synthase